MKDLSSWVHLLWAWLPWIVAATAATVSFANNLISIWESKTFRKWFGDYVNRWRALRMLRLRRQLAELEAESELR